MNTSINDEKTFSDLKAHLKFAKLSWLELGPHSDFVVGKHTFAVFSGTLSKSTKNELYVVDAWLVCAGGVSAFYNRDNYPNAVDAVAQHIGRLAIEGSITIVEKRNATRRSRKDKPPTETESK